MVSDRFIIIYLSGRLKVIYCLKIAELYWRNRVIKRVESKQKFLSNKDRSELCYDPANVGLVGSGIL